MIEPLETNSGRSTSGKPAFGLEYEQFIVIACGWAGAGVVLALANVLGGGIGAVAVGLAAFSALAPMLWILLFVRGKPPCFQRDLFATWFGGGRWFQKPICPKNDPLLALATCPEKRRPAGARPKGGA